MNIFSNKKIDPVAEAKLRAITEELEIKTMAFQEEARIRTRRLENEIEDARHDLNVAKHEINEDIKRGIKKVNDAAISIVLPHEIVEDSE